MYLTGTFCEDFYEISEFKDTLGYYGCSYGRFAKLELVQVSYHICTAAQMFLKLKVSLKSWTITFISKKSTK